MTLPFYRKMVQIPAAGESDSDSKDSSESQGSIGDCYEDVDVYQEGTVRWSQSRNSDSSGDDEVDGQLEGKNNCGNPDDISDRCSQRTNIY